eukprot:6009814-Alexandrium_andersonii.AAC.1
MQRPLDPAAGGCGPSAQKARTRLIPGPNSEEIGSPRGAELGAGDAALRAALPGPRAESWGVPVSSEFGP